MTIHVKYIIKSIKTDYDINSTIRYQVNIQNNDYMFLKSIVTLPEIVVNNSRISLPYTNILERVDLHADIKYNHKYLKKNRYINSYIINNKDSIDNNIYENGVNTNQLRHFIPETNIDDTIDNINSNELLDNFLNKALPSKIDILKEIKNKKSNLYSIKSIIEYSQPYLLSMDNIDSKDLEFITKIINVGIQDYKTTIKKYSSLISKEKIVSTKIDNSSFFNIINLTNRDEIMDLYKIFLNNHSNSEILSIITSKDDGFLFLKFLK